MRDTPEPQGPKIDRLAGRYEQAIHCRLERTSRGRVLNRTKVRSFDGTITDLSINGAAIIVEGPARLLAPGKLVEVVIDEVRADALIRRQEDLDGELRVGVEFLDLSNQARETLYAFIAESRQDDRALNAYWNQAT